MGQSLVKGETPTKMKTPDYRVHMTINKLHHPAAIDYKSTENAKFRLNTQRRNHEVRLLLA